MSLFWDKLQLVYPWAVLASASPLLEAMVSEGGQSPEQFCWSYAQICSFWHQTNISL